MDKKPSIFNLTLPGLEAWAATRKEPPYRAKQVLQWLYQKRISRFREMSDLSERLRDELDREFLLEPLACARKTGSRRYDAEISLCPEGPQFHRIRFDSREPGVVRLPVGPQNTLCFNAGRLCLRLQVLRKRIGGMDEKSGARRNSGTGPASRGSERRED